MKRTTTRSIAVAPTLVTLLVVVGCGSGAAEPAPDPDAPIAHPVDAAVVAHGQEVYTRNCAPCHGPLGKGDGPASATLNPKPRDHSNGQYMDALSDQQIADTIRMGGVISGYPNMPSSPHIRGDDMVALVAFVRTLSHDLAEVGTVELKPE